MILKSTKFGGNRTKDVEVGPARRTRWTDGQTDRQADSNIPPKLGQGLRKQILEEDYPKSITADR